MYKKTKFYFILLILILISTGCEKGEAFSNDTLIVKEYNNIEIDKINHYKIDVDLDYKNKKFNAEQWTTYVNNLDVDLEEIYFHLYPNAFKTLDSAPILFGLENENPHLYDSGYIDIEKISIEDEDVEYEVSQELNTILKVKLNKPLLKGENALIYFKYRVKFPSAKDRFGYGDRVINSGNWYPIACVYDKDGWNLDPYYKLGDPFYSDTSNYKITLKTDKDVIVAATGNIHKEDLLKNEKIYHIEGKLVRDFAWSASPNFKLAERDVEGTNLKFYYLDKNTDMINYGLKVGEDSLKAFNQVFGKYPYGQYSIVMTEFPSGMEYPGIVFIGNDYFSNRHRDIFEQIIVHETAHQWWYGLVGNDQIDEAWLDEGLATYSEVIYNKQVYGDKNGEEYFVQNIKIGYEFGKSYLGKEQIVNKPLNQFFSWNDYGILVYTKGAMFINQIEEIYGKELLYQILNTYYEKNKFYNATTEDFIKICEEITKSDFTSLVNTWLN